MPKLKCDVKNCFYYHNQLCTKGKIDIDGPQSRKKRDTSCMSFIERDIALLDFELADLEGQIDLDGETEVFCDAVQCVFSQGNKCHADRIEIKVVNERPHDQSNEKCDNNIASKGYRTTVVHRSPKPSMWVRFLLPLPWRMWRSG